MYIAMIQYQLRPDQINWLLHGFVGQIFVIIHKKLNVHAHKRPSNLYLRPLPHGQLQQALTEKMDEQTAKLSATSIHLSFRLKVDLVSL